MARMDGIIHYDKNTSNICCKNESAMLQNVSGPYFKVPEQVSLESIIFSHYETL
jgi:hypothetical protein